MRQDDAMGGVVDGLSPLARNLIKLGEGAAYSRLVISGPGNEEAKAALDMISPDQLLVPPVTHLDDAKAMLAGLWLWHDWLDESHAISQNLRSETGSFWHAILHRREGDFSNSKYWYDRCDSHPMLPAIGQAAASTLNPIPADKSLLRILRGGWDPGAFVDLVAEVHRRPGDSRYPVVEALQQLEWRMLFDHCAREAVG